MGGCGLFGDQGPRHAERARAQTAAPGLRARKRGLRPLSDRNKSSFTARTSYLISAKFGNSSFACWRCWQTLCQECRGKSAQGLVAARKAGGSERGDALGHDAAPLLLPREARGLREGAPGPGSIGFKFCVTYVEDPAQNEVIFFSSGAKFQDIVGRISANCRKL